MPTCALLSFRLGLTDGVSIVAETWRRALEEIGFDTVTVAGEGPVDRRIAGLAIGADPPSRRDVAGALADVDLVVVENLCTIPLNLPASRVVAKVLAGRPAILHHHDPPWQRAEFAAVRELPATDPAWRHVTINRLTEAEFAHRGIAATTIYNGFVVDPGPGDRSLTRERLGVGADELLFGHPVRAIARKNIPAAIRLCEELDATYWLAGPAEDGYDATLRALLDAARCRVVRGTAQGPDLYAAPDLIVFPSTWEGFGNPPVEAAIHGRMAAVGDYPVAAELRALGFSWLAADETPAVRDWLAAPDEAVLEANRQVAATHFSSARLTRDLHDLVQEAGWLP